MSGPVIRDVTELKAIVVCRERAYEVPKDVADELTALSSRLALAEADAKRLDAIDACWANGIHIEVCATGSFSGTNLKKIVTVFYGDDTHIAETVRDALDLLNAALAGKGTEK